MDVPQSILIMVILALILSFVAYLLGYERGHQDMEMIWQELYEDWQKALKEIETLKKPKKSSK